MRVLIVKTSSLGDLVHTFPAVSDAAKAIPDVRFDWVVEEAFTEVPAWHPSVDQIIPISLRRWRKNIVGSWQGGELRAFYAALRQTSYDLIIDAQGLFLKSGCVAWLAKGDTVGYDWHSARDSWSSLCYKRKIAVSPEMHAIQRIRRLFAEALGYQPSYSEPVYGLQIQSSGAVIDKPYLVFLHGTTWPSKHWPEAYWIELSKLVAQDGYHVVLPWGSPDEQKRAALISESGSGEVLPRLSVGELAFIMKNASGIVGIDSGLAHIAAAIGTPAVTLYGPTTVELTGAMGQHQLNRWSRFECAPCMQGECSFQGSSSVEPACFAELDPLSVWTDLQQQMAGAA